MRNSASGKPKKTGQPVESDHATHAAEATNAAVSAAPLDIREKVALSERTTIKRHPERTRPDLAEEILCAGRVAHVGFAVEGQPFVVPLIYHYEDGIIYLHGAPASRLQKTLRSGVPVCIEVTLLDGLVASRNAKSHSTNYRSVVAFGTAELVEDDTRKRAIFERMTARYFPGRSAGVDYIPAEARDFRTADLHAVMIEELSAKSRSGPPMGADDGDNSATGTSYVILLPGVDG